MAGVGDLNGDGREEYAVGSPGVCTWGPYGEAFVRVYSGLDGELLLELHGDAGETGFGSTVAPISDLDGDGTPDILVGDPTATVQGATGAGIVIAFSGATGAEIRRYDSQGTGQGGALGTAITQIEDVDSDGVPDIVSGAPDYFIPPDRRGVAIALSGATGAQLFRVEGIDDYGRFGSSVADLGDIDGDGTSDFAVGAPNTGGSVSGQTGRVYLWSGTDGSPIGELAGTDVGSYFGASVIGVSDLDADGVPDMVVGAPAEHDLFGADVGAVHYCSGRTGVTSRTRYGSNAHGGFGASLAGLGDQDADGVDEVGIAGPSASSDGFLGFGAAYVYSGRNDSLLLELHGPEQFVSLGRGMGGADTNGDGRPDVILGAPAAWGDTTLTGRGVVLVFGYATVLEGRAFTWPVPGNLSLDAGAPEKTLYLEPVGSGFSPSDVLPGTLRLRATSLRYDELAPDSVDLSGGVDVDGNGVPEIRAMFGKSDLRALLTQTKSGAYEDTLVLHAATRSGVQVRALLPLMVSTVSAPQFTIAPNPMRRDAILTIHLPVAGYVAVRLFDVSGRHVAIVLDRIWLPAGYHDIALTSQAERRARLASGIYFVRVETPAGTSSKRVVVLN